MTIFISHTNCQCGNNLIEIVNVNIKTKDGYKNMTEYRCSGCNLPFTTVENKDERKPNIITRFLRKIMINSMDSKNRT